MSQEDSVPGKSRRRFLADLLFLGGGVTAASLLAKSTLFKEAEAVPEPVSTPERPVPVNTPEPEPPHPGQMVLPPEEPQMDGAVVAPQPQECEPQIEGKMKMPVEEPNPAGGAVQVKMIEENNQ